MKKQNIFLLSLLFASFIFNDIKALDYTWVSGGGNWDDPSKWLPIGIPGPSDTVEILSGGPTLISSTVIENLSVLSDGFVAGIFDLTVNGLLTRNGGLSGVGLWQGPGTLTVNGDFVWLGGAIGFNSVGGSIIINGLTLISGSDDHTLYRKTLVCVGGVNWESGRIICRNDAHWVIPPGATMTQTSSSNVEMIEFPIGEGSTFENQGHFIKSGTGDLWINLSFINSGTFTSNGGPIRLSNNCSFENNPNGIFEGSGSIVQYTNSDFTNLGSIRPGLPVGELTFSNNPSGVIQNNILDIDISGSGGPGTGHDRLNITGDFDIAGSTLELELIGGYSPPPGTSFQIALTTDSVIGIFSTLNLPPDFIVTYAINGITVLKNASPVCSITNPPYNGFLYYDPNVILVEVLATDVNDTVTLVEFFLDSIKFGEDNTAPYSNSGLVNTPMGMYTLTVMATDSFGITTVSMPVDITVRCIRQDIDNDGIVNTIDFLLFLSSYGNTCNGCPADFNLDGAVNTIDFLSLLADFGYTCN